MWKTLQPASLIEAFWTEINVSKERRWIAHGKKKQRRSNDCR